MMPMLGADRRLVALLVLCGTTILLALIVMVGLLSYHGASNVDVMLLVTSTINPIITILLYGRVAHVDAKVGAVERQVNGRAEKDQETILSLAMAANPAPTSSTGSVGDRST